MQTLQLALARFGFHKWQNLLFFIISLLCFSAGSLFICLSFLLSIPQHTIDLGAYTGQLDLAVYIAPLKKLFIPCLLLIIFSYFFLVSLQNLTTRKIDRLEYRTAFLMGIPKKNLFRAIFIHKALWVCISSACSFILLFLFQNLILTLLSNFTQLLLRENHLFHYPSKTVDFTANNFWNFDITSAQWLWTVFLATIGVLVLFILLTYLFEKIETYLVFYQVRRDLKHHDH